jgi:hypothetical protein
MSFGERLCPFFRHEETQAKMAGMAYQERSTNRLGELYTETETGADPTTTTF